MAEGTHPGEVRAWEILASLNPDVVCRAAAVSYDAERAAYIVRSFGMDFRVSMKDHTISSPSDGSAVLLQRLGYFFRISALWYLASAKNIALTGRPVKLERISGGEIFTRGSHVLPLDSVAKKYGTDSEGFIRKGKLLHGEAANLGDISIKLFPLPRVPVILSLWLEDEEFPARVDLFFDSTCELQLPTDIIWSVAMMSVLIML